VVPRRLQLGAAVLTALAASHALLAQIRLSDEADRAAFRAWFVLLADAAYYTPVPEVTDCAGLIRYAIREALRPHTPDWLRRAGLPVTPADVRERPAAAAGHMPLFRISADPRAAYAEFADARTLIRYNARFIAREPGALRPGDLLYYQQPAQHVPDHVMVFVGPSPFDASATDFVVYHTGPADDGGPGEMRKARLADLERHPATRWRPVVLNRRFVGIFRLTLS
jgi:uncharacterized protein YfaT (DUF1175 family)